MGKISETIGKVTMARSVKNIKTVQVVTLTTTHRTISFVDSITNRSIGEVLECSNVHTHTSIL